MKASDLRQKSRAELPEELMNMRKEQCSLSMRQATGPLARTDQFNKVRKSIARVKTVIREVEKQAGEQS